MEGSRKQKERKKTENDRKKPIKLPYKGQLSVTFHEPRKRRQTEGVYLVPSTVACEFTLFMLCC